MIPQGREAGSSFPPCFFSLHSHLQRLLPPPAHDVTYIRTSEEHSYNTVEWRHRERQKKELLRLTFLIYSPCSLQYMLKKVTSVSCPFRQPIFISASPNNTTEELAFLLRIQEVPRFNSRPQDWLSSLLRDSFWYDQVNSGTAPQIMAGPNPCTYFHFFIWRYTIRVWDVCLDLLDRLQREPEFFSRVITGDESWILEYDPETKRQIWEWHTANFPRPKKARMSKSKIKSMLICFLKVRGSSTRNLCYQDKVSIKFFYREVLESLRKRVARVRPVIART